ncbi:MAG: phage major capsid protein [Deltaproteobacteria bacterium]|nr:phage major capsid protein [Deltaproteobacteria bacterium]
MARRVFTLELGERASGDTERVVEASLSSEEPVERAYGREVLRHTREAVDLSRAKRGLALLFAHDPREPIGRVEAIRLEGRRLRGRLRFGNGRRARELFADVLEGLLPEISIGYSLDQVERQEGEERDTYTATRWTPFEVSLVAIAADPTVGIGRAQERIEIMEPNGKTPAQLERERIAEIRAVAERWNVREQGERAINEEWASGDFKAWTLKNAVPPAKPLEMPTIGMGGREIERYSLVRAAKAFASRDWRSAGLELEASEAVAKQLGREARGFFVPPDVLTAPQARTIEKGGGAAGAALVGTELLAGSFIDLLRNNAAVRALGATILPGLVGDVDIPRQSGAASAQWLAEGGTVTASDSGFDAVSMTPKTVAARTNVTRKMLLQGTPAIEHLVRNDLALVLGLAVDLAAIAGSGAGNQPLGILGTTGVGSVAIGANGGPPTWAHVVALEREVAADNADVGSLAYLTNAKVRSKLKTTEKATDTAEFVWEHPAGTLPGFGLLNGSRAAVSNQVPSNLVKGSSGAVCSAIIFGNWRDLLIGEWGVLDVTTDPITLADSGGLVLRAFYDVDVAVRHPESFAILTDATTT